MSRKRKSYSADFKAKLVLELLEGEKTLNEIASKYEVLPKSLQDWKKQFLTNASLAFDKSAVVKEYKEKIKELEIQKDATAKKLGEVIVERDWAVGKLKSLDLSIRKEMIDTPEGVQAKTSNPSLNRQLGLLHMSKTAYYYKPVVPFESNEDIKLLNMIDKIHTKYPYYGTRRVEKLLKRVGFNVGRKLIKRAFEFMGIIALYPKPKTTVANKEHKKYPYLLEQYKNEKGQVSITQSNEVWSTDITYIRLANGYAYLACVIDWYSKRILSWKLSSTMDTHLTTSVLQEALQNNPKPKIFNTDQGSQYTAKAHVNILVKHNISISMDAKGRSIDNIVIERFWRSLKYEDVYPKSYTALKEAKRGIGEYIDLYNSQRLHSALDYKTPDEVYYQGANNKCYDAKKVLLEVA